LRIETIDFIEFSVKIGKVSPLYADRLERLIKSRYSGILIFFNRTIVIANISPIKRRNKFGIFIKKAACWQPFSFTGRIYQLQFLTR
jgi:hypothetical protein